MMVAAHSSDLAAAAAAGLRTTFIARPNERGPGRGESVAKVPVDVSASSLLELADRLGIEAADKFDFKLEDLVAGISRENVHDEVDFGGAVGREAL